MLTQQEAKHLDREFQKAFQQESLENANAALAAWDYLWSIRIRENNFTHYFDVDEIDWQLGNWANDTTMALHNAHMYAEEIRVNKQILQIEWDDHDNIFHENAMRDIADAYADMGDIEECFRLYENYLKEDPLWGWAWIGYYRQLHDYKPDEFLPILESLYAKIQSGVEFRDKKDLYMELQDEFALLGDVEKSEYLRDLWRSERKQYKNIDLASQKYVVKQKKIYPNDPCPCGSGKKYKKCCGKK